MYKMVLAALVAVALVAPALGAPAPDGSVPWPTDHKGHRDVGHSVDWTPEGLVPCESTPVCTACCDQGCTSRWWCVFYCLAIGGWPLPDAWEAGDLYRCYDPATGEWYLECFDVTFQGCLCAACAESVFSQQFSPY
jgi:hypothetical protein